MKYLFVTLLTLLILASVAIWRTAPDMRSDVPVLYWATDPNPVRYQQIDLFHQWLVEQGYTTPEGRPKMELRLYTAGRAQQQRIIQGVSGVASDIMDSFDVPQLQAIGFLADVTEEADALGFDLTATYPALEGALAVGGRQYGYPCNAAVNQYWVNQDTFAALGMDAPPLFWDVETFERIGREFVQRANPPGERQTIFFASAPGNSFPTFAAVMMRDKGQDVFNETGTRSLLAEGAFAAVLERVYRWTYDDGLFPTAADEASFTAASGYGGANLSLLISGNYGMILIGRHLLVRLREISDPPRVSVSQIPCNDFPNAMMVSRAATVYQGSPHKDLAALFLAFLAGEVYNLNIVNNADALPPNPLYADVDVFHYPPEHPNEWGSHTADFETAKTIALAHSHTPYIPSSVVNAEIRRAYESVMAGLLGPEEAAEIAARRVNAEIDRTLRESETLQADYAERQALQQQIEDRRAASEPVPVEWLYNAFHRRYYAHQGWLADPLDAENTL